MTESFFEKIRKCLGPPELASIILDTFSHRETARLMASEGIVYPGVRMESVGHPELTLGWAEDALGYPSVLSGLEKLLDQAYAKDIQEIRLLSVDEIEGMIESVPKIYRRRKVGGLVWALIKDERADVAPLLRRFLESFYRYLDKQTRGLEKAENLQDHLRQGRLSQKEAKKVGEMLAGHAAENEEIKKRLGKSARENDKLGRQVEDLKKRTAAQEAEAASLRNDLAGIRKETARKDERIRELEEKAKTISKDEEESLRRRLHELERNERKMRHEISDLNEKLASAQAGVRAKEDLCRQLERELEVIRLQKEGVEGHLKRFLAKTDGEGVPTTPVEKPAHGPKEKGRRLGVFVDTRSLRQACKRLGQTIDFQKLLDFIIRDRHPVKVVAYVVLLPEVDQRAFLDMLERKGFQVRARNLIRFSDNLSQANWGAGMATDVISLSEKMSLDVIHLVSGDGDFVDLIKFLKAKGIRTETSGFEVNSAPALAQSADEFSFLGDEVLKSSARAST